MSAKKKRIDPGKQNNCDTQKGRATLSREQEARDRNQGWEGDFKYAFGYRHGNHVCTMMQRWIDSWIVLNLEAFRLWSNFSSRGSSMCVQHNS